MNLKKIKDDTRSEQRLRDLLKDPYKDWRHYRNQLNKCAEDKRRERVQTWYNILLEEKPEFAKKLEQEFGDYLSEEQEIGRQQREDEARKAQEEQQRQEREVRQAKENKEKQEKKAYEIICNFLYRHDRLAEVASRHSKWNSYGGRIGSYSHQWSRSNGRPIKDIYDFLSRIERSHTLIKKVSWTGGYDHDFGVDYEGGTVWKPMDYKYINGSYDSDEDCTIYYAKRCPKPIIKECLTKVKEQCQALSEVEITNIFNSLY